jgi:hypothetical protein
MSRVRSVLPESTTKISQPSFCKLARQAGRFLSSLYVNTTAESRGAGSFVSFL